MSVVKVTDLCLSYGETPILYDVSLAVKKGEFFVIIGPNGSGKTTLLKTLARLEKAGSGSIDILDAPLAEYSRRSLSRVMAVVPQQVPLDFPFTVEETVLMGRSPHLGLMGVESQDDYAIAQEAMGFTDIQHLAKRRLDQLSGGERQRVIIARAICQQPRVILLDEPTAALDPAHQVQIMDLMERFRRQQGITVIMVSHDLNLAALYGDRLLLLKEGRIETIGAPQEVLTAELLSTSYGCPMQVNDLNFGGLPQVMPIPEKFED